MSIEEDVKALREALAMGPTQGEWEAYIGGACAVWSGRSAVVVGPSARHDKSQNAKDAQYIAAANPAVISRLLAELEARGKDAERYRYIRDNDLTISRHKKGVAVRPHFTSYEFDVYPTLDSAIDTALSKGAQEGVCRG
jgi:hypothetical protein